MKSISSDPSLWGKHFWRTLEVIACTLTPEKQDHVIHMIHSLQYLLPCEVCKGHFKEYLREHPVEKHARSPLDLLRWIHDLQCVIRTRQHRESLSFDEYLDQVVECFDVPEVYYYYDKEKERDMYRQQCTLALDRIFLLELMPEYTASR